MKFTLQPYAGMQSRYRCPACNHRTKTFTRYINTGTGEAIAPQVGKCDRLDKCGYHLSPGDYFKQTGARQFTPGSHKQTVNHKRQPGAKVNNNPNYYIHPEQVNRSFASYGRNNFVQFLIARFGFDVADELVGKYRIGTSKHWQGATIFWQLDTTGHVRSGKIMLYNKATGKRVKQPFNHITWVHTLLFGKPENEEYRKQKLAHLGGLPHSPAPAFILKQCLFGEHLLITAPYKPVAIVESEKTAIIAATLMPEFIWLASGSLDGLSYTKCKVLQGRQVMLFPDVNGHNKWKLRAMELQRAMPGTKFAVSDKLEQMATAEDKQKGIDLADVLV